VCIFYYLENSQIKLIESTSKDNPQNILIFVNLNFELNATLVECDELSIEMSKKYILNMCAKTNTKIESKAVDKLIEISNNKFCHYVNECKKLTEFAMKGTITLSMVENYAIKNDEYFIYSLTNAIDEKNLNKLNEIYLNLKKTLDETSIFMSLGSYFRRMFMLSLTNDEQVIQSIFKNIKIYAIKKSKSNILKNGKNFYIEKYKKYCLLNYQIVSGKISASSALSNILFM